MNDLIFELKNVLTIVTIYKKEVIIGAILVICAAFTSRLK